MADNINPYRSSVKVPLVAEAPRQTQSADVTGAGLMQLGEIVTDFVERKVRADRAAESLAARSGAITELDNIAAELERDADYSTVLDRFDVQATELQQRLMAGLSSEAQKRDFQAEWDIWRNARQLSLRDTVWKRERDANVAGLDASIDDFMRRAAEARNEVEYAAIFSAAEKNISEMAEAGWITREDAVARAQKFRSGVDETTALRLISANPVAAVKQLRDPEFLSGIAPDRRVRLVAAAEAEMRAIQREQAAQAREARQIARGAMSEAISVMRAGLTVDPSLLRDALQAAEMGGDAELRAEAERVYDLAAWQDAARKATPLELEEELIRLEAEASRRGADDLAATRVTIGRSMLATMTRETADDPLGWAARQGKVELQPINPAGLDPQALRERAKIAEAVGGYYGVSPKYFTAAERAAVTTRLKDAPPEERANMALSLASGFGHAAPRAFGEISKDEPVFAHLGGLGSLGSAYERTLRTAFIGQKAIEEGADLVPTGAQLDQAVTRELGTALGPEMAASRHAIIETAKAIYTAEALKSGRSRSNFSERDFRDAISRAAGAVEIGGETYGGLGTWNAGWWGDANIILPPGVTEDQFVKGVRALTDDDLQRLSFGGGYPRHGDGSAFSAAELRNAFLVTVGPGVYRISMTDPSGAPEFVQDAKTGGYYQIDLRDPAHLQPKKKDAGK